MEAARKIRAVQFIFTSLPGELPGEGFTSYAFFFFFPSPLLLKSHLKCASWSTLQSYCGRIPIFLSLSVRALNHCVIVL